MNEKYREISDTAAIEGAMRIIAGFLDRFEAPTCIEQQEIVSRAYAWLNAYENDDFRNFAAKAINKNT